MNVLELYVNLKASADVEHSQLTITQACLQLVTDLIDGYHCSYDEQRITVSLHEGLEEWISWKHIKVKFNYKNQKKKLLHKVKQPRFWTIKILDYNVFFIRAHDTSEICWLCGWRIFFLLFFFV